MSGKGKGGKGGAAAKPAAPAPPPPAAVAANPALLSAGARLLRRRPDRPDPLSFLTPEQRALAETLAPPPPPQRAAAAPPAADAVVTGGGGGPLGTLGLPLDAGEVSSLLHQSLGGAVGQSVAFQPFVFDNIFQSAAAAASYVASACESGVGWGRVERFFLAAVDADRGLLQGVRVQVKGRLSRKNDMAQTKTWQWGSIPLSNLAARLDYGFAAANTRLGALGIKVWICYKPTAVKDVFFPATGGSHHRSPAPAGALPRLRLDELYGAAVQRTARVALPYRFASVGWWERPAPAQPAEARVGLGPGELFEPGFDPRVAGHSLDGYLRRRREARRTFRSARAREAYLATVGRFLAKQRRLAALGPSPGSHAPEGTAADAAAALPAGAEAAAASSPLGRRAPRRLGRINLSPYMPHLAFMRRRARAGAERREAEAEAAEAAAWEDGKGRQRA